VQSPKMPRFLFVGILVALTFACSVTHLPEQSVSASTSNPPYQQESTTVIAIVKARKANIRYRPSASATVVRTVNQGELLSLASVKPNGPWYQLKGAESWIHGRTIDILQTTVASVAAPVETQRPRRVSSPVSGVSTPVSGTSTPVSGKTYVNVNGVRVRSPVFSDTKPDGASARCRDGSYSFSMHRRGTCSYHGGVAEWF
jgi:hypothetical protein